MTTVALLEKLKSRGIELRVESDGLHYRAPKGAMTPELRQETVQRKLEIIQTIRSRVRVLDGHRVVSVLWETSAAVIFEDENRKVWRYLHGYKLAWPVTVSNRAQ